MLTSITSKSMFVLTLIISLVLLMTCSNDIIMNTETGITYIHNSKPITISTIDQKDTDILVYLSISNKFHAWIVCDISYLNKIDNDSLWDKSVPLYTPTPPSGWANNTYKDHIKVGTRIDGSALSPMIWLSKIINHPEITIASIDF